MGFHPLLAGFLLILVSQAKSLDLYEELKYVSFENAESTCVEDIKSIFNTALNTSIEDRQWALRMIDSSAKVPNGLLDGNLIHIGQFDECLKVVHPSGNFVGQHCMASVEMKTAATKYSNHKLLAYAFSPQHSERDMSDFLSLTIKYGICLPSSCSVDELNQIFNTTDITDAISIAISQDNCWTNEPTTFSDGSWAVISIFIILLVLSVCSTLYELYQLQTQKTSETNIFSAFSLYSNTISLFEIRDSSGEMACLHGMRTLSMMWVLLCHTFMNITNMPVINFAECMGVVMDIKYILIINGFFSVDSFFFLSGLLVAFVFFRNIGRSGYYDAPVNYIHRYFRLTPALLIMVLFNMTIIMDLDKGPMWGTIVKPLGPDCQDTWWSTILYVQNYAQPDAQCVGQSWYLSADMQMFWIAPLVLYPIYLWPKIGMAFLAFLTIGSTCLTFGLAYENEYKASLLIMTDMSQFDYDYITTHSRIMPWFVGLALGVAICAIKSNKIKIQLSKMTVVCGWLFSTALCLGILYGFSRFQGDDVPSVAESAAYLAFTRLGWGVGLAWIVFACIYGYGGWINSFLSWGIFQPLGKLSYHVYLVHMTIYSYLNGVARTNFYFSNFNVIYMFFGTLVLSYLFAIVLYLLLDAPFAKLDRKLLSHISILPYPSKKEKKPTPPDGDIEHGNASLEKVHIEK